MSDCWELFTVLDLYKWQLKERASSEYVQWITHDGPPYANGNLHMGHFENKVDPLSYLSLYRFSRISSTDINCFRGILEQRTVNLVVAWNTSLGGIATDCRLS